MQWHQHVDCYDVYLIAKYLQNYVILHFSKVFGLWEFFLWVIGLTQLSHCGWQRLSVAKKNNNVTLHPVCTATHITFLRYTLYSEDLCTVYSCCPVLAFPRVTQTDPCVSLAHLHINVQNALIYMLEVLKGSSQVMIYKHKPHFLVINICSLAATHFICHNFTIILKLL